MIREFQPLEKEVKFTLIALIEGRNEISIIKEVQMLVCVMYLELKSSACTLGSPIPVFQFYLVHLLL